MAKSKDLMQNLKEMLEKYPQVGSHCLRKKLKRSGWYVSRSLIDIKKKQMKK